MLQQLLSCTWPRSLLLISGLLSSACVTVPDLQRALNEKVKECGAPVVPSPDKLAQLKASAQKTSKSTVVLIYREGIKQGMASCGGVVVAKGIVATAYHCVRSPEKKLAVADEKFRVIHPEIVVLSFDPDLDVAMIEIDSSVEISAVDWATNSNLGQTGYLQGYPRPVEGGMVQYAILPLTVLEESDRDVLIKGDVLHGGTSGSPVFSQEGRLIGIFSGLRVTESSLGGSQHWRSAARATAMMSLVNEAKLKSSTATR